MSGYAMKIILLTSSLNAGGAERVATVLCNAWAARGDTVTLVPTFSGGGTSFYEISDEVETLYLADVVKARRKTPWTYAQRLFALRKLIQERDPDVVISFLPNVNVAAILSTFSLKIPVIVCERSDPSMRSRFDPWEIYCRFTYRYASMLTVQTEAVARKVRHIYPAVRKVRSVPNPLSNAIAALRAKKKSGRKILLSLGRLSPEKQVDKAMDAFADVASRFEQWDLHIYGEGPLKELLKCRIRESGLEGRVFLKGQTSRPWEVMSGADAFVMTSRYEGFPNALMEAMGIGLPCVVSDCPSGPREISCDGKDALLVPLDDHQGLVAALSTVMSDENFRMNLGHQARESVFNRFSLAAVLDHWDALFAEVMDDRPGLENIKARAAA